MTRDQWCWTYIFPWNVKKIKYFCFRNALLRTLAIIQSVHRLWWNIKLPISTPWRHVEGSSKAPLIHNFSTRCRWVVKFHVWVALPPGEGISGTHWLRVWVDPKTNLDFFGKKKCCPFRDSNPNTQVPLLRHLGYYDGWKVQTVTFGRQPVTLMCPPQSP